MAQILFDKYRAHLPLNRQSDIYAKQGVDIDVSTLADWVGACSATLAPLVTEIEKHVLAAERIHADDTTVPVLAKNKCTTGRLWAYVRDDQPFGGTAAPAVFYRYSPTRGGEHPEHHLATYAGLMQADAYAGFNGLYAWPRRLPSGEPAAEAGGRIIVAACWAHRAHARLRHDAGASSLNLPICKKPPSPSKLDVASTNCSPSNARSTVRRRINAARFGRRASNRWLMGLKPGCVSNAQSSRRRRPSPKLSTTA